MDWDYAIERNREALKRVLAALVAMAGLAVLLASGARPTLPRHLHRAVLRLLRPAESAVRRLVIVAARGLVVALPRSRPRKPKPKPPTLRPGVGTGILMPPHLPRPAGRGAWRAERCALPLFDPLHRWGGRRRKAASGVPRISVPGLSRPLPVPPERQSKGRRPLAPDDAIDAVRLALRLEPLASVLDDLPREARRFARWRMRAADAPGAPETQASGSGRVRRLSPLRPGRPPGSASRPVHAVHDILSDTHALAFRVVESPDTS
ncbi:MAG TPA: hypothetical protein VGN97_21455 [Mesorhizobium sp.]|jgi:hypothetical protein|nr:hypothetical protein [Mesorhizobium sp.]